MICPQSLHLPFLALSGYSVPQLSAQPAQAHFSVYVGLFLKSIILIVNNSMCPSLHMRGSCVLMCAEYERSLDVPGVGGPVCLHVLKASQVQSKVRSGNRRGQTTCQGQGEYPTPPHSNKTSRNPRILNPDLAFHSILKMQFSR